MMIDVLRYGLIRWCGENCFYGGRAFIATFKYRCSADEWLIGSVFVSGVCRRKIEVQTTPNLTPDFLLKKGRVDMSCLSSPEVN
jgi:hypothetical protein